MVVVHVDWILSRSALRRTPWSATESISSSRAFSSIPGGPPLRLKPPRKIASDIIVLIVGRADGLVRLVSRSRTRGEMRMVMRRGMA
jgi:hypothetical protein